MRRSAPDLLMSSCGADSKSQFYIIDSIDVYSLSAVYLIVRSPTPRLQNNL